MSESEQLIARADLANKAYENTVNELHEKGKEDSGELTDDFEVWREHYEGMSELLRLATRAHSLAENARDLEIKCVRANFGLLRRPSRIREIEKVWSARIKDHQTEIFLFRTLRGTLNERWFHDPTGRHQFRYRGSDWTIKVKDGDIESFDPM